MKLRTKLIQVTDLAGRELDLEGIPVEIILNKKAAGKTLDQVLVGYKEFDEGEIYGQTLLGFYNVQDDGSLFVDGSHIQLFNQVTQENIKVTGITRPGLNDDCEVSFEDVKQFIEDFNIEKPDEVFTGISEEEKDVLLAIRQQNEASTRAAKAQADKDLKEAEAALQAKALEDADAALRAKIKSSELHDEKSYKEIQAFYKSKDCKEYVSPPFHVFFGAEADEEPCLLIRRGAASDKAPAIKDWWQEPDQTAFEDGPIITFEHDDLGEQKKVVFNSETGVIKSAGNGE